MAGLPADTMARMGTVPVDEAQAELPRLVDAAERGHGSYEVPFSTPLAGLVRVEQ